MDTDKHVAPLYYSFGLQNLRHHTCCRAIKTNLLGVTVKAYQWLGIVPTFLNKITMKYCLYLEGPEKM